MGAWGTGPFDNDDAGDFAIAVASKQDLTAIEAAFDRVLATANSPLDASDASNAIAGAEILAMLLDHLSADTEYPEEIDEWAAAGNLVPSDALLAKARSAMDLVLGEQSELRNLWAEGDELDAWKATVTDVKARLVAETED